MSMRIAVLGGGSWGTTLSILLTENEHDVAMWDHDPARAQQVQASRVNDRYLAGVKLPDGLVVTSDLSLACRERDLMVFVVPSHTVRATAKALAGSGVLGEHTLVVCATKGLEEGTHQRMSEVLGQELGIPGRRIVSLVGPSHAEEVSRGVATSIVAAGSGQKECRAVQEVFGRPYFRVYTNDDIVGAELATALKNSIAIAAGILDGAGGGDNTKAALVTRGLAEITRLGICLKAKPETFSGLAGVGDLVVTCLSRHSRNRRVGEAIGRGQSLDEALSRLGMVAEGVRTTNAAVDLGRELGVELPIIEMVHRVLFDGHDPREAIQLLMTRPPRAETRSASHSGKDKRA